MTRKPRNFVPHLTSEYARRHPDRPPKTDFNDEVLCAVAFVMRQIDPYGKQPIIEPAMPAEGYEPQPSVRSSTRREQPE
jgi:hypothetical protein